MLALCCLLTQWVEPKFENVVPDGALKTVPRTSDSLPLWDQSNAAHWRPYQPMWDEFRSHDLDPRRWIDRNPGWNGRQPGWFNSKNIHTEGRGLDLIARLEAPPEALAAQGYKIFSTAAVQSIRTVLYGAFEVRARPMKSAVSSAFWFFNSEPTQWTEIDVFEIGGRAKGFERKDHMTVHVFKAPDVGDHHAISGEWTSDKNLADEYHDYGLEWNAKEIRWYFDGVLVRRGENRYWHQPLTLNLDCETMPGWFGLPDPNDLPSTYSIDFVRAWKVTP